MTRITNADQALMLLQEQLKRVDRARPSRTEQVGRGREGTPPPMARLQSLAALDQLSEDDVRRTLVRALILEEVGEGAANDSLFQKIVDDVFRIISSSREGLDLVDRATRQLRETD